MMDELLRNNNIVGVVGNKNEAKTSLILYHLTQMREQYPHLKIAALGINDELHEHLRQHNIEVILSKMDILDLKMRDTVIFIDEFALLFDTTSRSKQLKKLRRFCDRIVHNNCKLIIATTQEGFYNKFLCALVNTFIVKKVEYDSLVNGTWLQERVKAITSSSDYRLECAKNEYFVVSTTANTTRHTFPYTKQHDTKKANIDLFAKASGIIPKLEIRKEMQKVKRREKPEVLVFTGDQLEVIR